MFGVNHTVFCSSFVVVACSPLSDDSEDQREHLFLLIR
jgi:hypothetical protein